MRIGTAARLSPQKKLEDLIAAIRKCHRRLPPYELLIAGEAETGGDEYAQSLRRLANHLPVKFVGEQRDVRSFLHGLDLFVMISEPAGCPNASLEALAEAVPVVATDHGGAAEQVIDGVTGRLTPRGDNAALAEAIADLASDSEQRAKLAAAGRAHVQENFSLDRMLAQYRKLLGL